jgi:two-component sensor histidine kinase
MDLSRDSRARLIFICLLVVLMVWLVGFGFDRLLARDGVTRNDILLTSNLLTGIVAGFLFYSLTDNERLRRNVMRERLRTIAEMNHHIRNSLQVITYATATQQSNESVEMIRSSVERIEWALREVLPGHVEAPAAPEEQDALRAG